MGKNHKIDLGHIDFDTKKLAESYFRQILLDHEKGTEFLPSTEKYRDLWALIQRHPERGQKVGCGIAAFIVWRNDNGHGEYRLRRTDGTDTDFSYLSCVKGKGPTAYQEFAEAARFSVVDDIREYRSRYFATNTNNGLAPCEDSGQLLGENDCHVDHHPFGFKELLQDFLAETGIVPSKDVLSPPADNQTRTTFICEDTERRFVEYHRKHAKLKVVHKTINLSRKRRPESLAISD